MRPLFRQEAIDAQREKLLGAVSSARPVPLRVFTAIAAAFAIALVVFAFWGEYTRRERVEGFLAMDGAARVLAPEAGVIQELFVKEGADVKAGTVIAKFLPVSGRATEGADLNLELQRQRLQLEISAAKQLTAQQEEALRQRIAASKVELEEANGELELQTARVNSARDEVERGERLVRDKFQSESMLTQKKNDLLEQQAKAQSLRRTLTGVERDLIAAKNELSSSQIKLSQQIGPLERKISEIEGTRLQDKARREVDIVAPFDGAVTNIAVARGDSLAADASIATVLPRGTGLRAQLLVPTRASGFIAPGNDVVMRYDAFPFQRFGQYHGKVDVVSRTVWSQGERVGPMVAREPVYRVDVKLDRQTVMAGGQEMPLRPGMILSADILLEKRTVFEWVFEPVLELRGRLQ
ncbi:MAG TPA: HlyD family efflux transporter periplasmic adaptor subunit [Burkholderiaceae bacterium]|nr:HlyD family efflux transporter periplasmic adaptor subunit [Burkholderiaceae bacterium]